MANHDPHHPSPNGGRPSPDPVWPAHGSAWAWKGAGLLPTTNAVIVEKKDKATNAGVGAGGDFGYSTAK